MPVNIHISGEDAGEAVKELAVLAAHLGGRQATPIATETSKQPRSNRSTNKPDSKPDQEEPPVQNKPDLEDGSDDDGAPIPTVVDLRAKASEVGNSPKGKEAVKALLNKFGSKSISDVPEDKRAAFMAELEKLAGPIDISDDDMPD